MTNDTQYSNGHQFSGDMVLLRDEAPEVFNTDPAPTPLERWRHRLPEIVTEPQPSIAQLYRNATTPEVGNDEMPVWKAIWAYMVAIPVKTLGMAVGWVAEHPARTGVAAVLAVLLGTALAHSDLAGIVPTWLDLTSWF